jgi:hypothetical protein
MRLMAATKGPPDIEDLLAWQERLTGQVEELRAEISFKQEMLAQVEERLALVTKLLEVESRAHGLLSSSSHDGSPSPLASAKGQSALLDTHALEDQVEEVLRAAGEPMHISAIRDALLARAVPIPGRGDDANIIVRLRRLQDRFTRTARGTYGLTEWGLRALASKTRKRGRAGAR